MYQPAAFSTPRDLDTERDMHTARDMETARDMHTARDIDAERSFGDSMRAGDQVHFADILCTLFRPPIRGVAEYTTRFDGEQCDLVAKFLSWQDDLQGHRGAPAYDDTISNHQKRLSDQMCRNGGGHGGSSGTSNRGHRHEQSSAGGQQRGQRSHRSSRPSARERRAEGYFHGARRRQNDQVKHTEELHPHILRRRGRLNVKLYPVCLRFKSIAEHLGT